MKFLQGLTLLCFLVVVTACNQSHTESKLSRKALSIKDAFEEDFRRTYDPALGYPPKERMVVAMQQIRKMRKEMSQLRSPSGIEDPKFIERGPDNIGGRTRTIVIDQRDPERKAMWIGSVAGGLWRTEDVTADDPEWHPVDDYLANLAIGCAAQDPREPRVLYVGTGEGFPNFEAVRGLGIFKSEDGGISWNLLPSTDNNTFRYTRSILVHPVTSDVYAATNNGGVRRSQDGGLSWTRVLGVSLTASDDDMFDLSYEGGMIFASNSTNIYRSATGDRGAWSDITGSGSGFPNNLSRVEFSVCASNIDIIYAVGSSNGSASDIFKTMNGGNTWNAVQPPTGGDFTNGQAWYDLDIAVDPFNCNHVIVGGVGIYRTLNGGAAWNRFAQSMHVDQHKALFDPEQEGVVYFGNDGGFWRSAGGSDVEPADKNPGYITTQYYGCAMHPDTFSNYFLGGTQDNGSHRLNNVAFGDNVWGGDGFYAHIDQLDPSYQMVSSQYGNWGLSTNGGVNFSGGQQVNGGFINPSDYDSRQKILYTQTNDGNVAFYRWHVVTNVLEAVSLTGAAGGPTYFLVDPVVENRLYLGTGNGSVIKIDNAHEGDAVAGSYIYLGGGGTVSGIDVLWTNPDRIIVTRSNYGVDNIVVTSNGGENWTVVDGNLPDMPVRAVLFNPNDGNQAMIATEAGVWTTTMLDGDNTIWIPPSASRGIPLTRTDDLEIRSSDLVVLAGTHGRGLWTSSVFAQPKAKFSVPLIHYVNAPVEFFGDASLNAESFAWTFGDGGTSNEANPTHFYNEIGTYDVKLTINNSLSTSQTIKILPEAPLPWVKAGAEYGGDFEGLTEQYGAYTVSGSGFQRGKSTVPGKNGTHSGDNAWVIGLNQPTYSANTESYLYLPLFDFSQPSIYTFSFWARYLLHPGPDGFLVEYSLNRGKSWSILGSTADKKWYNFNNSDVATTAFPDGTPYFTGDVGGYTNFTHDLTFLSGEKDVAFRFVFRSEATGNHVGLAIDDVEIISYQGELKTQITSFTGEFGTDKDIDLKWSTIPEYYCRRFEIERSVNGRDFEKIDEVQALGVLTANQTNYTKTTSGGRDLYFYRLKVISQNVAEDYYYEFYTDTITIRRNSSEPVSVHSVFPNPFIDNVNITFNDVVNEAVTFKVFDVRGRLLLEEITTIESPFHRIEFPQWPQGVYYLSIQIGEEDAKVYPLMNSAG